MVIKDKILPGRPKAGPEMQRVVEGWVVFRHTRDWQPPTDVYETADGTLVIQVEIAGMREAEFSLALGERMLVIRGVRGDPVAKRAYHQMEIRYGEFRTEVYLPWDVDVEKVEAVYEDGFLCISMPRTPARRVPVAE